MRALASLAALLALAACSAPQRTAGGWPERWQASGRVGFCCVDGDGAQGRFRWRQDGLAWQLVLSGPFGSGRTLVSGIGEQWRAPQDMQLPEGLPVDSLQYWLRGLPDPGHSHRATDGGFVQRGWTLQYSDHARLGGRMLARRIEARRGDARTLVLLSRLR